MKPRQSSTDILWLNVTDSTNKVLKDNAEDKDNLSVVAALRQTAGRGQGDHTWHSREGENLTFSILFRPQDMQAGQIQLISCAAALGIRDYLLSKGVVSRIKWPNDIWVEDKKICGMLIENVLDADKVRHSIIGIGLNLNQTTWPSDLPNPVSLSELTGMKYNLKEELEQLMEKIGPRFALTDSSSGRQKLQEEFGKYVFRLT